MLLLNHLSTKCQQNESFKKKGCHETFSWPMQVVMQRAKCQYPKPVIHKKYSLIDGKYRCAKYSKIFLYQASATRHGNIDWAKGKKGHKCIVYSKVFPRKAQDNPCKISIKKCLKCQRYVRRKDFLKHKELCFPNPF